MCRASSSPCPGIFEIGMAPYDNNLAADQPRDAQKLLSWGGCGDRRQRQALRDTDSARAWRAEAAKNN